MCIAAATDICEQNDVWDLPMLCIIPHAKALSTNLDEVKHSCYSSHRGSAFQGLLYRAARHVTTSHLSGRFYTTKHEEESHGKGLEQSDDDGATWG